MKKLFISVPMRGRTEENIRTSIEKMHKMAEIIFGEELEVISSYIEDRPPKNSKEAVWYLGKSIQLIAEADYVVGTYSYINGEHYSGCETETGIASSYRIPYILIDEREAQYIMPDLFEDRTRMPFPVNESILQTN